MESERIRGRNWKQIHVLPEKTRQKIKPCIETSAQRRKGQQLIDPWRTHRLMAAALTCPLEPRLFLENVRNVHTCRVFMS